MKKEFLFIFLTFILIACTPQVTVTSEVTVTSPPPTETLIPTPTLHPEYVELQNIIADSGENLILLPNGQIEENGVVIPNLQVDQNGEITILAEGKNIVIDSADITFDDGFHINGYELNENGDWVEAMTEAEQQMYTDFEKYGQDLDNGNYTFEIGENDSVTVKDVDSNDVYINGSFEPLFLGQLIIENNMCQQTEWMGVQVGPSLPPDLQGYMDNYGQPLLDFHKLLVEQKAIKSSGNWGQAYYLGNSCWAMVAFRNQTHTTQMDARYFWKNQLGRPLYEKVFITPEQ